MKKYLAAGLVGVLSGSASAFFLWLLDRATQYREGHPWLLALLPLGGVAIAWVYRRWGRSVERGSHLILDEIHEPKSPVPLRLAPLILFSTVATHFFGGSAGREGTAVQMGGSLADGLDRFLHLSPRDRKVLLRSGMSAGFASVFGTPLAGTVFSLEVLRAGKISYDALGPCLIAAFVGHYTTLAWGIRHTAYWVAEFPLPTLSVLAQCLAAGVCFGLGSQAFTEGLHRTSALVKNKIPNPLLRPLLGGSLVAVAAWALGTSRYLGLGIPVIVDSFKGFVPAYDFLAKVLFTTVTLGTGFKGGEVTPLFFIGATLGNSLAHLFALPLSSLAAMGFVAVFAGAANTPLASTLMAMELFGWEMGIYAGLACLASYLASGKKGIYGINRRA